MRFELFLSKLPSFEVLRKHSKRQNKIFGIELDDLLFMPYWDVKTTIPELMKQAKIEEIIHLIFRNKKKSLTLVDVKRLDNYEKLMFFFWVEDQYKIMNRLEEKELTANPDAKLSRAGIKKLDVLGYFNVIDDIVKRYSVYSHDDIKRMPYSDVFDIQLRIKIEGEIQKKLAEDTEKN